MLSLFLFPGKVFAELSFLWSEGRQNVPTSRRRNSKLAHFVFAIPFWFVFCVFGVPIVYSLILNGIGHAPWMTLTFSQEASTAALQSPVENPETKTPVTDAPFKSDKVLADGGEVAISQQKGEKKPTIKFAEQHEVVQELPQADSSATYQKCSATITDHCVER